MDREMVEMIVAGFTPLEVIVMWADQGRSLPEDDQTTLQQLPPGIRESLLHTAGRKRER